MALNPKFRRRILFVRHGQTDWNAERRMQGQRNIPLNALGEEQAIMVGQILPTITADPASSGGGDASGTVPDSALEVWCSPLMRCLRTYELATQRYEAITGAKLPEPSFDDRLKEITFGRLEGKTLDELPSEITNARQSDHWGFSVPGAESYADGAARAVEWLAERGPAATKDADDGPTDDPSHDGSSALGTLLIFSHGGICRGLRHHILGMSGPDAANSSIPQGVVIEWYHRNDVWIEEIHSV